MNKNTKKYKYTMQLTTTGIILGSLLGTSVTMAQDVNGQYMNDVHSEKIIVDNIPSRRIPSRRSCRIARRHHTYCLKTQDANSMSVSIDAQSAPQSNAITFKVTNTSDVPMVPVVNIYSDADPGKPVATVTFPSAKANSPFVLMPDQSATAQWVDDGPQAKSLDTIKFIPVVPVSANNGNSSSRYPTNVPPRTGDYLIVGNSSAANAARRRSGGDDIIHATYNSPYGKYHLVEDTRGNKFVYHYSHYDPIVLHVNSKVSYSYLEDESGHVYREFGTVKKDGIFDKQDLYAYLKMYNILTNTRSGSGILPGIFLLSRSYDPSQLVNYNNRPYSSAPYYPAPPPKPTKPTKPTKPKLATTSDNYTAKVTDAFGQVWGVVKFTLHPFDRGSDRPTREEREAEMARNHQFCSDHPEQCKLNDLDLTTGL